MGLLSVPGAFAGHDALLAAHAVVLPQPDQLCGPFAAHVALHAVLEDVPAVVEIARCSGTAVWPHDVPAWRPSGAPLERTGWDVLPRAASPEASGTDAEGLSRGVEAATGGRIRVVPAAADPDPEPSALGRLLAVVRDAAYPLAVVANVDTGALSPALGWVAGHFVVPWAYDEPGSRVAVADSYHEVGEPGLPPGCRWVPLAALAAAIAQPPGRGLLLLVGSADPWPGDGPPVADSGLRRRSWST